ncbi:Tetratricopeptide repeat-containing protein [Duganella sp. CF517]|nr:Tetratricopeptide repeat-containing protein [Duganella sp. CF517]
MFKLRSLPVSVCLSFSLLCFAPSALAQLPINDAAAALLQEGDTLLSQRKAGEALRSYEAAAKADPTSSVPLSKLANAIYFLSILQTDAEKKSQWRAQSEALAQQALKLAPRDPIAQEVLRMLSEEKPAPLHEPTAQAANLKHEGEQLFVAGRLDQAREKYLQAAQADPLYSTAWIYAGDCYFAQKKWAEAEQLFRKGVTIEPLNSQGWRFLSDALGAQGKRAAAEEALLNGIAAQPSQMPNWGKLAHLRAAAGTPLKPLGLVRKSSVTLDPATGKPTVKLDSTFSGGPGEQKTADAGAWLMLGMREASIRAKNRADNVTGSPFAIELASWEGAMKAASEIEAKGGEALTDPGLIAMQTLAKADQLEAGLLILLYKESYRPEFEAWKKEHPNGIRKFVDTWGLQP